MKTAGRFSSFLVFLMLSAFPISAQAQQGSNTGDPGDGTPRKGVPRPPVTQPPRVQSPELQKPSPAILAGSVALEDGSPPPMGTVIELDCGGKVTREATVNSNGSFSFDIGETRDSIGHVMPDASEETTEVPYGMGSGEINRARQNTYAREMAYRRLGACDLRAQLSGYRSTVVRLQTSSLSLVNQLGLIILYPAERVQGTAVSATPLLAPKKAKKSVEKAKKALRNEKPAECEALLKSAIGMYPRYAEAWAQLGLLFQKQQRNGDAREALQKAIALDEKYVNPYVQLGWIESTEQKWQAAADVTEQALALDPITNLDAYFLNAVSNYNLRNYEMAEKRGRQELRLDSAHRYPRIHLILASIAASRNDHETSSEELRNYLKHAPGAPDAQSIQERLQEQERLAKAGS